MASGDRNYGRVEISVDGVWGSLCNRYWDTADASAFCRSLGYAAGAPYYNKKMNGVQGPVYAANLHCEGNEESLNNCPHEGWAPSEPNNSCADHNSDAAAICFNAGL